MKVTLRISLILVLMLAGVSILSAQHSLNWVRVTISATEVDTLTFGVDTRATYGMDTALGESEGPPSPPPAPGGWAIWEDPNGNGFGEGHTFLFAKDFRAYTGPSQLDTFEVNAIPDLAVSTQRITFTWQDSASIVATCDSIVMQDAFGGTNVNWLHKRSVTVSNKNIQDFYIYRYGAKISGVRRLSPTAPSSFSLHQNYPNPFNPTTNIDFAIAKSVMAEIAVYDVLGRKVSTLVSGQLAPGTYTTQWNGTDGRGVAAGSGVYFVRMVAHANGVGSHEEFSAVRKLLLMK
ncbi:MAG: FlgD immunoglobulin-like domain containing protein [Bacteroidota bacterium]|jgi:hypothetical protein